MSTPMQEALEHLDQQYMKYISYQEKCIDLANYRRSVWKSRFFCLLGISLGVPGGCGMVWLWLQLIK